MFIYQATLTREQVRIVNTIGFDQWEHGAAYLDLVNFPTEANVLARVVAAVEADLMRHNYTVTARSNEVTPDDVFDVLNGAEDDALTVDRHSGRCKSGSVGDVYLSVLANGFVDGWVCMPDGWAYLDNDASKWFLSKVHTHERQTA